MAELTGLVWLAMSCFAVSAASGDSSSSNEVVQTAEGSGSRGTNRTGRVRPDQLPVTQISSLTRDRNQAHTNSLVRIQGVVQDQGLGEYIVIQDETGSIRAETRQTLPIGSGERVVVWGRLSWDGNRVILSNASIRPVAWDSIAEQKIVPAPGKPDQLPVLNQVRKIRELSPSQAAWKYPVHVHGVITTLWRDYKSLFVQDETAGIFVASPGVAIDADWHVGDEVEVEGISGPGGYAPIIEATSLKVSRHGKLPEPRLVTLYQMATGQHDSQWVEVRGVVRSVRVGGRSTDLQLSDINGLVEVDVQGTDESLTNLLDSVVHVRGVCASRANVIRQLTGAYVWSPSTNCVIVAEKGVSDPFTLPTQPIASLSEFTQRRSIQQRVKIAGVVTVSQPRHALFVQDETGGVPVYLSRPAELKSGDRVEVAGYLALGDFGYVFRNASCRVTGHGHIPAPRPAAPLNVLNPALHGTWVEVDARLRGQSRRGDEDVLTLQADGSIFEAIRPGRVGSADELLPPMGSLVRLRGVYSILGDDSRMPRSLCLYVPAEESILTLEKTSWWNTKHTSVALGVMGVVLLAAALWAVTLRRRVGEQTLVIRERLEKETALERRYREIFESASDLIFTYDLDGKLTSLNPAGQRILGYTAEEAKQLTIDQVLGAESQDIARQLQGGNLTHAGLATCELELVARSGRRVVVEASSRLMYKDGVPVSVQAIARDISERKQTEDALQQSELKFRSLVERSLVGVYIIQDEHFAYVNPRLAEIFGYTPEEMLTLTVADIVFPEDLPLVEQHIQRRLDGEISTIHYHFRAQRKDRTIVFIEVLGSHTDDGSRPAIVGTLLDVTERTRAEAALAEASSLLEMMLENSPDYIYFKDRQSRFVRSSQSLARMFGLSSPQELKGKSDFDFFLEEHARPAYEDEQEIIRTGKPLIGKPERETHADGRVTWALTTKLPWRDKAGNIVGTFGISKDVTSIREAEEKLAHERELFHALTDNLPDAIYFKDRESRFVRLSRSKVERSRQVLLKRFRAANPSFDTQTLPVHLTDTDKCGEYLIGKTDFDVYEEARARMSYTDEQEIINTGQPLIGKLEQTRQADGNSAWFLTSKLPWRDKTGKIVGTFGVSRDITTLKEAETKLEVVHKQLLETSRLAGMAEVATDVLHNVGNVLNSVNVSCSLTIDRVKSSKASSLTRVTTLLNQNRGRLSEFFASDPRGQQIPDYLAALAEHLAGEQNTLLKELEQLLKHIDHIKQIVSMQQSYAKVAGVKEAVTAVQLVEDALHINAAALSRHDVHVKREFEDAPPIQTEKHKVLQILVNLIRNAKYAMDEAKRQDKLMTIKVGTDGNGHAKIEVIDNGVGIPEENLTRIFAHGFTTRRDGHGFGLHSSALAVRELGGSLQAHSDGTGKGATFTLLLPFDHQPDPEKPL